MFSALRARIAAAHHSGNIYLALSGASALVSGGLYISAQRELQERRQLEAQFDALLAGERTKARNEVAERNERLRDAPVLWRAVVTQHDPSLVGHKMLRGSLPGAGVDVLEQQVGDQGKYLMVRDRSTGALGMILDRWVTAESLGEASTTSSS